MYVLVMDLFAPIVVFVRRDVVAAAGRRENAIVRNKTFFK
jgi:hypothetical protein